ncbi:MULTISPECIES: serine/threonine-protein kinase [unclassified Streptomyces]|nr:MULTISPECIES: serine/threonine-protein kinase [unclassified Streptomyces]AEN09631.1 serine/threonine protein kinase with extracellular ligand sensor(s) [Streptomyces sp. SirexAA-E]MYR70126.1 protein kinase [Streptomyces sp. SID4939]MYS03863.1 protein kinase [Streptomyces sp. SID4940]MYT64509.1 protein kinase [Streptomyces sp. SID8357]MYT87322.1 protein kinase [Streptomyces sp. SID8360]
MHSEGMAGQGSGHGPDTVIAGRYRLLSQLGRGGMGVVWEALDTSLDRKVAVKGLLYPGAVTPVAQAQWVNRARREAQAIARIGHQNVVAVHDVIEDGNQVWIVMELLNSRSLADLLREQQQLSVPHAARIGLQVLRGLTAVHEAGVLHRDVKPHNILFRPDGRALLMDFGIATFEGAVQVTRSHEIIGTPQYLAPELLSRTPEHPHTATAASDLWALGVTLYEMVEGRRPFDGATSYEVLIAVRESPAPPMKYAGPLAALIDALLRKDPAQRPDATEAERMLQDVTRDFGALDTPAAPRPARPARQEPATGAGRPETTGGGRRDRWKVPAAVLCTALLAGTAWFVWGQRDGTGAQGGEGAGKGRASHAAGADPRYSDTHDVLRIGVKRDQPGLSVKSGDTYKGFEVDLAKAVARELGFDEGQVQFVSVNSGNRSDYLRTGRADLVLATYSISDEREREEKVAFAGPYYQALKGLLVRKNRPYNDLSDLQRDPGAEVCTARDSVYESWIKTEGLAGQQVLRSGFEDCVKALLDPRTDVYAVATDDVIVAGLADKYHEKTKALDSLGGAEGYGVATDAERTGLHTEVCAALSKIMDTSAGKASTWARIYDRHLKPIMKQPAPGEPQPTNC